MKNILVLKTIIIRTVWLLRLLTKHYDKLAKVWALLVTVYTSLSDIYKIIKKEIKENEKEA